MIDALRLAAGTLTALPVPPPRHVDRRVGAWAMLLAPVAALPLAVLAGGVTYAGGWLELPPLVVGLLTVAALALGTRAFHWDGLSDICDGLTASYDRDRSLEVMKSGTSGPAGGVAVVLVIGLQAGAVGQLSLLEWRGAVLVGLLVMASRTVLAGCCARGVPPARESGLGATVLNAVSPAAAATLSLASAGVLIGGSAALDTGLIFSAIVAVVATAAWMFLFVRRCVQRFGGLTGDALGAAVETSFALLLLPFVAALLT